MTYVTVGCTLAPIAAAAANRLLCDITTPLGNPVEPLVYIITAVSSGRGLALFCTTEKTSDEVCMFVIKV